jgi:hypothetical protein
MTTGGFITLLVLLSIVAMVFLEIGGMPGRTARQRNHAAADAINLLGWLGLLFGGVGWMVAMVWARLPSLKEALGKGDAGGAQDGAQVNE